MGPNAIKPSGRVCLLKILNRRVRNRTHGGVRGRSLLAPPTRLRSFVHFQVLDVQEVLDGFRDATEQGGLFLERAVRDVGFAGKLALQIAFEDVDQLGYLRINGTVYHNQIRLVDHRQIVDGDAQIMRVALQRFLDKRIAFFVALDHDGRIDSRQGQQLFQFGVDGLMGSILFEAAFIAARTLSAVWVKDAVADFAGRTLFAAPQSAVFDDAGSDAGVDA